VIDPPLDHLVVPATLGCKRTWHLATWIKGLITVEYSKDSGPAGQDGRGIHVHELLVSNYICLFLLDLS